MLRVCWEGRFQIDPVVSMTGSGLADRDGCLHIARQMGVVICVERAVHRATTRRDIMRRRVRYEDNFCYPPMIAFPLYDTEPPGKVTKASFPSRSDAEAIAL